MRWLAVSLLFVALLAGCTNSPGPTEGQASAEYARGYAQGKTDVGSGHAEQAYDDGYAAGKTDGYEKGYDVGFIDGYDEAEGQYRTVQKETLGKESALSVTSGHYSYIRFNTARDGFLRIAYTNPSDPFDSYIYTDDEFEDYEGGSADPLNDCSDRYVNTAVDRTCSLPASDWVFVTDNSNLGPTKPDGTLTTRYTLRAWYEVPANEA